jgi:CheY-like chemotaxis protein
MNDSTNTPQHPEGQQEVCILVAEDDKGLMDGLQDLLAVSGYTVLPAQDGEHAITALEEHSETIKMIVSDITMPNMDGRQLLARVRENPQWASIPFVFLTAHAQAGETRNELTAGVCAYVVKPFEADDLLKVVQEYLSFT